MYTITYKEGFVMSNFGFIRIAAATPKQKPANTEFNAQQILECIKLADNSGCGVVVFPELCLTGSACGDLFLQDFLHSKSLESLWQLLAASKDAASAIIVGLFLELGCTRVNCAAFVQNGEIKGIVPKMFIPEMQSRWFAPGSAVSAKVKHVSLMGKEVPFGNLLFKDPVSGIAIGIEISDDMDRAIAPGSLLALGGAHIIANPSASPDEAGSAARRRNAVCRESRKNTCVYVMSSAGVHESTTDAVCGGHSIIAECGEAISESVRFNRDLAVLFGDLDIDAVRHERARTQSFSETAAFYAGNPDFALVNIGPLRMLDEKKRPLLRPCTKNPFIPDSPPDVASQCSDIFDIQCAGLAKRLEHTLAAKSVIGVSGGLDSTLALLVCAATHKMLGRSNSDILALTMPGFGTTGETHDNALALMSLLGTDAQEIPITDSVALHLNDIGHDLQVRNATYENSQARERAQILMDIANKENGIVVGTGDLSESALGWCTYGGDHLSMYNVNAGIPKTIVRRVIQWIIDYKLGGPAADREFSRDNTALSYILEGVLKTPVSPELLPPDATGKTTQMTEDAVGPYILNDFFIYHTLRHGTPPKKLLYLASLAFDGDYDEGTIAKWLSVFYERFFRNQFKRSCMPDGPKTGPVCLSPRGGWHMPSDIGCEQWLSEIASLQPRR